MAIEIRNTAIDPSQILAPLPPTAGQHLAYNDITELFEWVTPIDNVGLISSNFIFNEVPSGSVPGTVFTLANTPQVGTVQVFLNGLLQQPGSGKDYNIIGSTITFSKAVKTHNIILVHYIK